MMHNIGNILISAGLVLIAFGCHQIGWGRAHLEVAKECERQGNFYVGKNTFECSIKEKTK